MGTELVASEHLTGKLVETATYDKHFHVCCIFAAMVPFLFDRLYGRNRNYVRGSDKFI